MLFDDVKFLVLVLGATNLVLQLTELQQVSSVFELCTFSFIVLFLKSCWGPPLTQMGINTIDLNPKFENNMPRSRRIEVAYHDVYVIITLTTHNLTDDASLCNLFVLPDDGLSKLVR